MPYTSTDTEGNISIITDKSDEIIQELRGYLLQYKHCDLPGSDGHLEDGLWYDIIPAVVEYIKIKFEELGEKIPENNKGINIWLKVDSE